MPKRYLTSKKFSNFMMTYFIRKYLEGRPMFLSIIRAKEASLFQKHKKYIKRRVLDFGCGDGFFAETVFGKNKITVGLDLTESRARIAEEEKIYKKIVYYDGGKIPFPGHYFSTVISNCFLEHVPPFDKKAVRLYGRSSLSIASLSFDLQVYRPLGNLAQMV